MNLLERIEAARAEGDAEAGKKLIRAGAERGLSLAERILARLHRFAWRTPLHGLRLRGRFPLKLLAVPKDPLPGDRQVGEALLKGFMTRRGQSLSVEALDFAALPVSVEFSDYLHSFAWLRDLAAVTTREKGAGIAEELTGKWLGAHASHVSEPAWRPDLWGRRILFWAAYAPFILSSNDIVYRSLVLNTLARGARHLDRTAGKAPPGLARIAAWSGVIAAALVVQGGPARLSAGERGIAKALAAALHEDGGLVSRSPVEQLELVELLGQLRAVYIAAMEEMPDFLAATIEATAEALSAIVLGDGALSSWQGGNMLSKRRVTLALEATGTEVRDLPPAGGWGYQRLSARKTLIIFDAAPPPTSRSLLGGCASTLAFEMSDGENRLIVNCGGPGPGRSSLSAELAYGLRTTAAHSTLVLGDRNSTAVHDDGSLGKGVTEVELARNDAGGVTKVEASHDGYVRRFGLAHRRRIALSTDGSELVGEDSLIPVGRRRVKDKLPVAIRFHLEPWVEAALTADGMGALLRIRGSGAWHFRCQEGVLGIEDSLWIDGEAAPHSTYQLVISGETPPEGLAIAWLLRRAG